MSEAPFLVRLREKLKQVIEEGKPEARMVFTVPKTGNKEFLITITPIHKVTDEQIL